jgi:hypothetical protein
MSENTFFFKNRLNNKVIEITSYDYETAKIDLQQKYPNTHDDFVLVGSIEIMERESK